MPFTRTPFYQQHLFLPALWIGFALALSIRIWLVYHTHGVIDGDEALVGIQAQHILRGEHPVYFYAQSYMGSLEAYLMALLFALAGSSVWVFYAEPILLSLGYYMSIRLFIATLNQKIC